MDDGNLQLRVNESNTSNPSPIMDSRVFVRRLGQIKVEKWFKQDRRLPGVLRFEREM